MQRYQYLKRHNKYIHYRLSLIYSHLGTTDESSAAAENESVVSIMDYLIGSTQTCPIFRADPKEALNDLKNLIGMWDIFNDGDIAGYIYQQIRNKENRKSQGQFFTPMEIVEYIINKTIGGIQDPTDLKIFDPACGSGQFLISAYRRLFAIYTQNGIESSKAAHLLLQTNLFGNDIDPMAVKITRYNLRTIAGIGEDSPINIYNKDYVFESFSAMQSATKQYYDLIIGNPPWGSKLTVIEKRLSREIYSSASSGINIFTLFIEKALMELKSVGILAFLVPEAYLNIKSHQASRELILGNARILDIALWGEQFKGVFAPSASIIVIRERQDEIRLRHIVRINSPQNTAKTISTLIPQAYFKSAPEKIFNIHYTRKAVSLITQIDEEDCFSLKRTASFFLGIVTGNNPLYIKPTRTVEHADPIIVGKDVQQYRISYSSHYFKYDPAALQQVAPRHYYLSKNKVLYKFIGRRLTFALDREGRYSLNNVNGFIPTDGSMDPACLVALLNSAVMQYYYEKNFFTVKVLKGNLERLPLKRLSSPVQKRISALSGTLANEECNHSKIECRENIEDLIFFEYGIKDREARHIYNQVNVKQPSQPPALNSHRSL